MNPEEKNRARHADATAQERDELKQIKHLLRQSLPPLSQDQLEPRTNLWPQLHTRIEANATADRTVITRPASFGTLMRVSWFDWALAALAAAALFIFPGIIPALLYHF